MGSRMLQGELSGEIHSDSDLINYLSGNQNSFRRSQAQSTLQIVDRNSDSQGKQHYRLQQHYNGIPVYGMYITAHIGTDKKIYAITNDSSTEIENIVLNTQPTIVESHAINYLQAAIEQEQGYTITFDASDDILRKTEPQAELLIYPFNDTYFLAYRVELTYSQPVDGRWVGFVNAHTGEVLKKFDRIARALPAGVETSNSAGYYGVTRALSVTKEAENRFYLSDKTKDMYRIEYGREVGVIETYDATNPFFPIESDTIRFNDPDAVDAHYFAGQVYDFYASNYNRNSLDDKGMSIISVVNVGAIDNAYWNGYELVFGDGQDLFECLTCANDIIAHEFTHGVIEHTANLEYVGQSGALNESIADIMAVVFDAEDWAIGEDSGITGAHGVLRDLANPERSLTPQPASMSDYVHLPEDSAHDNGGIHTNSGIPNHAAYLIAKGIDARPDLQGQGRALLGHITYGALTSYLTPTSDFEAGRDAFVLAAGDLNLAENQRNDIIAIVKDAWATVGLPYTNNENNIISFHVSGMDGHAEINTLAHTVTFRVKYGTDLTALVPQIGISPGATITPGGDIVQDFTKPVTYTVTSNNGQSQTWLVQGSILNPAANNDIIDLQADILTGSAIIDAVQHKVTLYVEETDNLSAIQPSIELSEGASISPASGTTVNLRQPVLYTVTAEDGTAQQWTVTAIKDSRSPKVLGAVALGSTVVAVVFDQPMSFSTLGNAANYKMESLISSYSNPQITKVEVDCTDASIVYLTTSTLVSQNGYKLSVSNLKGSNGNSVRPDSTTGYFLTDDTTPPVLNTARIQGNQLVLTFNEPIKSGYGAVRDTFQLHVNGKEITSPFSEISSAGRRIMLTLRQQISETDDVQVSYTHYSHIVKVTDQSGNVLPSFSKVSVINRTSSSSSSAGEGWAHFNGTVKQMIKHPTEPIIYTIYNNSRRVAMANMDTGDTSTTTLDREVERIYTAGGKLYVALVDRPHSYTWWKEDQTGSIAILNEHSLETIVQFNISIDPFDLVVNEAGVIYVSSGSGQHTEIHSYSPADYSLIGKSSIRQRSYLQYRPDLIHSINTDVSPRDIHAYNVNYTGQFLPPDVRGYDSPYHGDYPMSTYLRISPDHQFLFNGAGTIFTSSLTRENNMRFVDTIAPFSSIVFSPDLSQFYTLSGTTLSIYNYSSSFLLERQIALPATAAAIMPGNQPDEILVAYSRNGGTTVLPYSLQQESVSALDTPSLAAAYAHVAINACPINPGGGSTPPPAGGGVTPPSPPPAGGGGGGGGTPPSPPPAGGGGGVTPPPASKVEPTIILPEEAMNASKLVDSSGNTTHLFIPDPEKLKQSLIDAQAGAEAQREEQESAVIPTLIMSIGKLDYGATIQIPASVFLQGNQMDSAAVLSIQADEVTYDLPVQAITASSLKEAWGSNIDLDIIKLSIAISRTSSSLNNQIKEQLAKEGLQSLTDAYNFTITLDAQGKSMPLNDFNGLYLTRTFLLTTEASARTLTALLYDPKTGSSRFVPAFVSKEGDQATVAVKTPHNSIYTVASSSKTFTDLEGHWAKHDIEVLAAKKVVLGITDKTFAPDRTVTRAEFATLLVRSLGLATSQASAMKFIDVKPDAWYALTASTAAQAGLIKGDTEGRFNPNGIITRQEMAVMINRAIQYAGNSGVAISNVQQNAGSGTPSDSAAFPQWSALDIKRMLDLGIMNTGIDGKFEPTLPVTRAHATVSLKQMLLQLNFINE